MFQNLNYYKIFNTFSDPKNLPKSKKAESRSAGAIFGTVLAVLLGMALIVTGVWFAFNRGYVGMPSVRIPNLSIPKIRVQRESSVNSFGSGREDSNIETPKDINSNDPFENAMPANGEPPLPKQKSTKINEVLPVFSTGNELLIEPDIEDD